MKRIFIFVTLLIIFYGCVKQAEKRLEGTWRLYCCVSLSDTAFVQLWTFSKPDVLSRVIINNDSFIYDRAKWEIVQNFLEPKFVIISSLDETNDTNDNVYNLLDGKYQILVLNKKYMFLQRTQLPNGASKGAFMRLEFAKE